MANQCFEKHLDPIVLSVYAVKESVQSRQKVKENPHNGCWYLVKETMHKVIVNKGLSSARYLYMVELLPCVM